MKIKAKLPDRKYFRQVESKTPGRYLWEDKASPVFRIMADFPDPFDREVTILISPQKMKSDNSEYLYRIVLRCFESDEGVPGLVVREQFKAVMAYSQSHCGQFPRFFGVMTGDKAWLGYSFYTALGSSTPLTPCGSSMGRSIRRSIICSNKRAIGLS